MIASPITNLSLGFSPCPNDTFIFDAMLHGRIDTEGLAFTPVITDVEDLNNKAFRAELDITKISFHAYAYAAADYLLLDAGSALGNNCGPLLIAKEILSTEIVASNKLTIAIPGKYTTANLLLSLAFPEAKKKTEMIFSSIEEAILSGKTDAGAIIHENRFTYQQKGLKKIIDLGEYWEQETGLPIPLGGITVKRNLPIPLQQKINRVMKRSVEYAMTHPADSWDFTKLHAQETSEAVILEHIRLYVNEFSRDLGATGKKAIGELYKRAEEQKIMPKFPEKIFVEET